MAWYEWPQYQIITTWLVLTATQHLNVIIGEVDLGRGSDGHGNGAAELVRGKHYTLFNKDTS
jgi:hypothetical protein